MTLLLLYKMGGCGNYCSINVVICAFNYDCMVTAFFKKNVFVAPCRFYSPSYSIAPNRIIAQTSISPYMHSPVSTYQVWRSHLFCKSHTTAQYFNSFEHVQLLYMRNLHILSSLLGLNRSESYRIRTQIKV